jgi:hypothetical protein
MNKQAYLDGYRRKTAGAGSLMTAAPTAGEKAKFQAGVRQLRANKNKKKNLGTINNVRNWRKDLMTAGQ